MALRVIVDACRMGEFAAQKQEHNIALANHPGVRFVIGGTLYRTEMRMVGTFNTLIIALGHAGRVHIVADKPVDELANRLQRMKIFKSNDVHILALAKKGEARLIHTADGALTSDAGKLRAKVMPLTGTKEWLKKFDD